MRSGRTAASVDAAVAPPRPPANPVLGSALEQRRSQIRAYERAMHEHGDVVRLVVGPPGLRFELYCVFHPDGVKAVLAGSRAGYSKPTSSMPRSRKAFGSGLLTSEGELWHRQRRLIQPLFTRRQIAKYRQLMAEEAAAVAERWDHASRNGAAVDANAEMVALALRVVGRAIFGDDPAKAGAVLDAAFPVLNRHTFRRAMSPLAAPASWPTPNNRRAARARQALRGRRRADRLPPARRRRWRRSAENAFSRTCARSRTRIGSRFVPHTAADSRDVFRAVSEPRRPRPGKPRRRCRGHRRGQRCGDAGVRRADDACIPEVASAHAALPPRSPWTSGAIASRRQRIRPLHGHCRTAG
jgi:hypothetical protein